MPKQRYIFDQYLCPFANCSFYTQGAIGKLSDEVLREIFRYLLEVSPRFWPILVHICRRWRRIVFTSHRALHLRLFCTHRTPLLKALDCWPPLPIVVEYGGSPALDPPVPEDEGDILAALKHCRRVASISLTITRSLRNRFYAIKGPFSELEHLALLSHDGVQVALPSKFQLGPQLRSLHLTGVSPLGLPGFLFPSIGLVDIQLHEIPGDCFSQKRLLNALSGMTRLRSLSLRFLHTTAHIAVSQTPRHRVVLPALTRLKYRGPGECLNAILDAPRLQDLDITFSDCPISGVSSLPALHKEMQTSYRQSDILFSDTSVSISLSQPSSTYLKWKVLCEPFSCQLSSIAHICTSLSACLPSVEDLSISATQPSSDTDHKELLKLIHAFRGTKRFRVAGGSDFLTDIASVLQSSRTVLPALQKLCVRKPKSSFAPLAAAAASIMHSRRLSGNFIAVEYEHQPINQPNGIGATFF
jgi:hypothetical protein